MYGADDDCSLSAINSSNVSILPFARVPQQMWIVSWLWNRINWTRVKLYWNFERNQSLYLHHRVHMLPTTCSQSFILAEFSSSCWLNTINFQATNLWLFLIFKSFSKKYVRLHISDCVHYSFIYSFICKPTSLCASHADWQNYLRTQVGNNTTVNLIISTVDYLLRIQESMMDFYWHYSGKDTIDEAGKFNFIRAIKVGKQVFAALTEYIQVSEVIGVVSGVIGSLVGLSVGSPGPSVGWVESLVGSPGLLS